MVIILAGFPIATEFSFTSLKTAAPKATKELFFIVVYSLVQAEEDMVTLSPILLKPPTFALT